MEVSIRARLGEGAGGRELADGGHSPERGSGVGAMGSGKEIVNFHKIRY